MGTLGFDFCLCCVRVGLLLWVVGFVALAVLGLLGALSPFGFWFAWLDFVSHNLFACLLLVFVCFRLWWGLGLDDFVGLA